MKVKELIGILSYLDPNLDAVIEDADEGPGSFLEIVEITNHDDFISIGGGYDTRYYREKENK